MFQEQLRWNSWSSKELTGEWLKRLLSASVNNLRTNLILKAWMLQQHGQLDYKSINKPLKCAKKTKKHSELSLLKPRQLFKL